jgi:hypothetical protein
MQSDQKIEKNHPILGSEAKNVAKILKLLKVQNRCIKLPLNVKISTINFILELLIYVQIFKMPSLK